MIPEVDPVTLRAELDGPNPPKLLDVRGPEELEISRLNDVVHIPLHELPNRVGELEPDAEWVVICRVGGRSGQATAFLQGMGFNHVRNLTGGMNRYAETVDPSLPIY